MNETSRVRSTLDRLVEIVVSTPAGAGIPSQERLAQQFGVSRTVLREALSRLEHLNVISVRPKTGAVVNDPSTWTFLNRDVLDWRRRADARMAVKAGRGK